MNRVRQSSRSSRRATNPRDLPVNILPGMGLRNTKPVSNLGRGLVEALGIGHSIAQDEQQLAEVEDNKKAQAAAANGSDFVAEFKSSQTAYERARTAVEFNKAQQDWDAFRRDNDSDFEGVTADNELAQYEAFMHERFGDVDSTETQEVYSTLLQEYGSRVRQAGLERNSQELFESRTNTAYEYLRQGLANDPESFSAKESFRALGTSAFTLMTPEGKLVKLSSEQREAIYVRAITDEAVAQLNPELLTPLYEKQPNGLPALAHNPQYREVIQKAKLEADRKRMLVMQTNIDKLADAGQLTLDIGMEALDSGVPYEYVLGQLNRNLSKAGQEIKTERLLWLIDNKMAALHKEPSEVQQVLDNAFDLAFESRDFDKMMSLTIGKAVPNGFLPTQAKRVIESITPDSNPEMVALARDFYNAIKQSDSRFASSLISDDTAAIYEGLNTAIESAGLTQKEALEQLAKSDDKIASERFRTSEGLDELSGAMSDLHDYPWTIDDIKADPFLSREFKKLMTLALRNPYVTPADAAEWAVSRYHNGFEEVNGRLIPRASFPVFSNIEDGLVEYAVEVAKLEEGEFDIRLPTDWQETQEIVIVPKGVLFPSSEHRFKVSEINQWELKRKQTEAQARVHEERQRFEEEQKQEVLEHFGLDDKTFYELPEETQKQLIKKVIDERNKDVRARRADRQESTERFLKADFKLPIFTTKT